MKFGQLIECNPRNIFRIDHIYGSTVWNLIKFAFILCASRFLLKYIKINVVNPVRVKKKNRIHCI